VQVPLAALQEPNPSGKKVVQFSEPAGPQLVSVCARQLAPLG
jgi:hypothetical protein